MDSLNQDSMIDNIYDSISNWLFLFSAVSVFKIVQRLLGFFFLLYHRHTELWGQLCGMWLYWVYCFTNAWVRIYPCRMPVCVCVWLVTQREQQAMVNIRVVAGQWLCAFSDMASTCSRGQCSTILTSGKSSDMPLTCHWTRIRICLDFHILPT